MTLSCLSDGQGVEQKILGEARKFCHQYPNKKIGLAAVTAWQIIAQKEAKVIAPSMHNEQANGRPHIPQKWANYFAQQKYTKLVNLGVYPDIARIAVKKIYNNNGPETDCERLAGRIIGASEVGNSSGMVTMLVMHLNNDGLCH